MLSHASRYLSRYLHDCVRACVWYTDGLGQFLPGQFPPRTITPPVLGRTFPRTIPPNMLRIHRYTCMHTHTHTHTYIHTHIHIHTYIYIHTYIHIHTYIKMHTYTCIHIHTYIYKHTYIHICMYVCEYTMYVCMY